MKERPSKLVERAVVAWVEKKFKSKSKRAAREIAWPGLEWRYILVHAVVRWPVEVEAIARNGVEIVPLYRVLSELGSLEASGIRGSAGTDLSEIIEYFYRYAGIANGHDID
jgi:hypothetical protein